jgi:hypothetical protein
VSAIVAHPASGENVGVSCERRKSRAAARRRSEQRRFYSANDDGGGGFKARCASSSETGLLDIGGALIPRMHSRPVEEVP